MDRPPAAQPGGGASETDRPPRPTDLTLRAGNGGVPPRDAAPSRASRDPGGRRGVLDVTAGLGWGPERVEWSFLERTSQTAVFSEDQGQQPKVGLSRWLRGCRQADRRVPCTHLQGLWLWPVARAGFHGLTYRE
eukprot:364282-Chlamydomonas_euryale.AAC.7